MIIYIIGHKGWIGKKIFKILKYTDTVIPCLHRMEETENIINDLDEYQPTHVIICAGRSNIDICENNKEDTVKSNVTGTLNIIDLCYNYNIHCTYISSGSIYNYDNKHPCIVGKGFTENDIPNFTANWYCKTKVIVEDIIRDSKYNNNTLTLRMRMPVSDVWESKNLILKLISHDKIINIPNSITVLPIMLPYIHKLLSKKSVGIFNFTNTGAISHNQIMDIYIKYIDPEYTYNNFTIYEYKKLSNIKRSNNKLDVTKLEKELDIHIPHIKNSIDTVIKSLSYKKP